MTVGIPTNRLYFGDNLEFLRNPEYFPPESVDLIYLDPELLKFLKQRF